jgi:hypothetical protein
MKTTFKKVSLFFLVLVIASIGELNAIEVKNQMDISEAKVICLNRYRDGTKHEAKIDIFSFYKEFKTKDSWIFKMNGKIKNIYGAWQKVIGHCEVPFEGKFEGPYNQQNIRYFEYIF